MVKGWCPGALRPMVSGDGLIVRLRAPMGRLTQVQAAGVAALADRYGNGVIDLSNRANVQLRGIEEAGYDGLIAELRELGLIDADADAEKRRNIVVTPFWGACDDSAVLAQDLADAAANHTMPYVSSKFGYAVDAGKVPVLQSAAADIRFERAADGALLLCAEGAALGKGVALDSAISEATALAEWARMQGAGRMARLLESGVPLPDGFDMPRQMLNSQAVPGAHDAGVMVACGFGQLDSETLTALATLGTLRLTPWRMVLIEGATHMPDLPGIITSPADPMLRVVACVGAPGCGQALGNTRGLARALAADVPVGQRLHVSGCAKGCAAPQQCDITLTAQADGYDLIRAGKADAPPIARALMHDDIIPYLKEPADAP